MFNTVLIALFLAGPSGMTGAAVQAYCDDPLLQGLGESYGSDVEPIVNRLLSLELAREGEDGQASEQNFADRQFFITEKGDACFMPGGN